MRCQTCARPLREGQQVVPVMVVRGSTRYDPAPTSQPVAYIHIWHLQQEEYDA